MCVFNASQPRCSRSYCHCQITRSGRIVPDKEYKYKLVQRSHQRHARECLAQAIFQKVLEMEVGRSCGPTKAPPPHTLSPRACIITGGNLWRAPPSSCTACPSDGDQTETGGVYKEGKSAKDQGTSLIFTAALLSIPMTHVSLSLSFLIIRTVFFCYPT